MKLGLERLLDFLRAVLVRVWDRFHTPITATVLVVLLLLVVISLAQLFSAVIPPECDKHWHHVTVPITVNGVPGTEDKWVCQ